MVNNTHLWEFSHTAQRNVKEIYETGLVTRPIALALASCGVDPNEVREYLNPALANLSDPFLLDGTEKAAERLWQAICQQENILIFGDYDTDGITSAVLLARVLEQNGANVQCYIPHRIDDGYGLTPESVAKVDSEKFSLLVTVDCGITSAEPIRMAIAKGLDVIVTDHHEPGNEIPEAVAIVDPKLPNNPKHLESLAGVGVCFKVCHAFLKYGRQHGLGGGLTDLREYLDLVALGTVADIVPLTQENRCLVSYGLQVLSRQHRPGVRALCDQVEIHSTVRTQDITYRIAPRINAAGRMGDPCEALNLLLSQSTVEAFKIAAELDKMNRRRQEIEAQVLNAAEQKIDMGAALATRRTIVITGEEWHQGVIGIVASRLVRKFNRPCIVLAKDTSGQLCGSGRSVRGVNLVTVLESCRDYLLRFGGHAMAAGLGLEPDNLEGFVEKFENEVQKIFSLEDMKPSLEICGQVELEELTERFYEELPLLEPFGHGNPEPVFVSEGVYPDKLFPAGDRHTRGALIDRRGNRHNFIYFGNSPESLPEGPWSIAFTPHLNTFNGVTRPQLRIVDIHTD